MPSDREVVNQKGKTHYLNSGDWIENLSWLEYHNGKWSLNFFDETKFKKPEIEAYDMSVNMEELIHPQVFAAFVGQKI